MESKIIRYFLIATCLFAFAANSISFSAAARRKDMVRIAVLKDANEFTFSVRGKYRVVDPLTNTEVDRGKRLRSCVVTVKQGGILIGEREYGVRRLRIIAKKDATIHWNGKKRRYRNQIDIILTAKGKFLVVNTLELESYVKGVLYHEVPHRWPMNVIKAQAVATRTYALYQINENKGQEYDMTSDIYSQVYGGRSAERYRTNIAVNRTRGQILSYRGKVLPAYFHSNCGGHTEDAVELWKTDLPPLRGVKCGFCKGMPNYRWKKNFRSKDIQVRCPKCGYVFYVRTINKTQVSCVCNSCNT